VSADDARGPRRGADDPPAPAVAQGSAPLVRSSAASPYPLSRLAPPFDLVDAAAEIARADTQIGTVVNARLATIQKQIRSLQDEARSILEEAQRSARLHRARSNFQKVPGRVYHLYRRDDGELYFSMLSPAEWAGSAPHAFEGSYRLGADMGWTRLGGEPEEAASQHDAPDAAPDAATQADGEAGPGPGDPPWRGEGWRRPRAT
jgi:hypothetical protein